MDPNRAKENQKKWDEFLSTIKTENKEKHTQQITITERKGGIQCLAYNFAHQLLANSDSTVTVTGRKEDISTITDRTDVSETLLPINKSKSFPEHKGTPLLTTSSTGSGEKGQSSEMQTSKDKTADVRDVDLMRKDTMQDDDIEKQVKDTLTEEDADGLTKVIPDNYNNETIGYATQRLNVNSKGVMKAERDGNQGKDITEIKEEEDGAVKVTPAKHMNDTRGLDINMSEIRHKADMGYKKPSGDSRSLDFAKKEKSRSKMKEEEEVTEVVPHLTSKMSAQSVGSIKGDVSVDRTRERNATSNTQKVKEDIDISCSQWKKMDWFSKYFVFDSTVSPLSIPSQQEVTARVQSQIIQKVMKLCKVMFDKIPAEATNDFFMGMHSNKTTVRILLDAIFLTLCSSLGCNIEVGKNIKSSFLVPCVFGYRILHKGNVLGSIEAKSSEGLKKESIIQAVLQLTILQAEVIQRGAESPPPLFNIVTDGVQFIFIQLKGEKLGFEYNNIGKLYINRVESITDLKYLLPKLVALVQMSKSCTSA